MSTYGVAVIADVENASAAIALVSQFAAVTGADVEVPDDLAGFVDDDAVQIDERPDGGVRVSVVADHVVAAAKDEQIFAGLGPGRAVLCDDGDEFGIVFSGWRVTTDAAECVYRAYVAVDDDAVEPSSAGRVVDGPMAAQRLAALWNSSSSSALEADRNQLEVRESLGFIGDPFKPWLAALGINWPSL